MIQTGLELKMYIDNSSMSVKDIQEYLHLSCPQPIYRWINGKILPSVDHLLMLSELFGTHMEELLVKKQNVVSTELVFCADKSFGDRILFIIENYLNLLHRCNCPWLSPWAFLINTLRQEEGE